MGYSYDKLGQRTGEQVTGPDGKASATSFTYTADGQVQGIVQLGLSVSSRYDALGRAATTTTKTAAGSQTSTTSFDGIVPVAQASPWGGSVQMVRDITGALGIQTGAGASGSQPAGGTATDGSMGEWGLSDRLSSTIATAAVSSGQVDQEATYSDFGVAKYATTGWDAQAGFSGEASDAATGLNAYYARTLDVTMGQFTSPDPWPGSLTDPQSQASHAYVHNNPATYRDWAGFAMNAGDWGVSRGSWRPTPPAVSHYNPQPRGTGVPRPDTMTYRGTGGNTCSPTSGCISRYFAAGRQQTAVTYRNGRAVTPSGQPRLDTSSYTARTPADASAPNYRPEPCYSAPGVPFCSNSQTAGAIIKKLRSTVADLRRDLIFLVTNWSSIVKALKRHPALQTMRRTARIIATAPETLIALMAEMPLLFANRAMGNKNASCGIAISHMMIVCSGFLKGTGFFSGGTTFGSVFVTGALPIDVTQLDRLLDHEENHSDQWAVGGPGFGISYLIASGLSGPCNIFERMAGYADGGYSCQ